MALPGLEFTIEDGALGTLPPNVAGASAKVGVCSKGVPGVYSFSDVKVLQRDLGRGPLVEAIAQVLAVAGGPVYACPIAPSTAGSVGAATHEGTGTGTVTGGLAPDRVILAKVMNGAALTGSGTQTVTVSFSVDGSVYGTPVTAGAGPWTYLVPGTLTRMTFPTGTYVTGEVYTLGLNGTVTQSGAGPLPTKASSPVDAYDILVEITTAGGLGAGAFVYSTDGGNKPSAEIAIPGGGVYVLPNTGVVLTFAGTFVEGDTYRIATVAASATTSDVDAALDTLHADPREWDHVHIVGTPTSAANAYTLAVGVAAKMAAFEVAGRYAYAAVECPTTEADSALISAFSAFASARVMVCAGDANLISAITGNINRRNCAWVVTARIALISPEEEASRVRRGGLAGVQSIFRDEARTEGLEVQRFTTLRTHRGVGGYYVAVARTMAPAGSDYERVSRRRVMDTACRIAQAGILLYVEEEVSISDEGLIEEKEAQRFEADIGNRLRAGITAPGLASKAVVVLSRTANLLSGESAAVTVRVTPKAVYRNIEVSMGFVNPAIAA